MGTAQCQVAPDRFQCKSAAPAHHRASPSVAQPVSVRGRLEQLVAEEFHNPVDALLLAVLGQG